MDEALELSFSNYIYSESLCISVRCCYFCCTVGFKVLFSKKGCTSALLRGPEQKTSVRGPLIIRVYTFSQRIYETKIIASISGIYTIPYIYCTHVQY